jgi:hypothetical protein
MTAPSSREIGDGDKTAALRPPQAVQLVKASRALPIAMTSAQDRAESAVMTKAESPGESRSSSIEFEVLDTAAPSLWWCSYATW